MTTNLKKWEAYYAESLNSAKAVWPNEAMLKCIFGRYLKSPFSLPRGASVLDVGCGAGGNLLPFLARGCACFGVEVTSKTADAVRQSLAALGHDVEIKAGTNRCLPFEDETFDLLLSINVVHYEKTEDDLLEALAEYRRVLKPGGGVYISTVGPEHEIYRAAENLGGHCYRIRDYDFRDGEEYFYFDSREVLQSYLERYFSGVETGRVTERLMTRPLDFLIAFARREAT